jgi:DNA-binding transcriptional MerR regulator
MRIGELAERAGTTTRTLRYYESLGLLPARRAENGYRRYDTGDLRLLRQIQTLQAFGFGLEETRPFVECLQAGHPTGDSCPSSLEVYRRKLAELDDCITRLREVRDQVGAQLARAELASEANLSGGGPEPRCELTPDGEPASHGDRFVPRVACPLESEGKGSDGRSDD